MIASLHHTSTREYGLGGVCSGEFAPGYLFQIARKHKLVDLHVCRLGCTRPRKDCVADEGLEHAGCMERHYDSDATWDRVSTDRQPETPHDFSPHGHLAERRPKCDIIKHSSEV